MALQGAGTGLVGINYLLVPDKIFHELRRDPSRRKEYEKRLKEDKTLTGRFEYYFTYLGRHHAYRLIEKITASR